jgi:hypothetical protein
MAVIHPEFLNYVISVIRLSITSEELPFHYDPLLKLATHYMSYADSSPSEPFGDLNETLVIQANENMKRMGVLGTVPAYFKKPIIMDGFSPEIERKIVALKRGYPTLPSTKMSIIIEGFGHKLDSSAILSIYASYGLVKKMKDLIELIDFVEMNRRIEKLSSLLSDQSSVDARKVHRRYLAIYSYALSPQEKKEIAIRESGLKRSLFFYFWKSFKQYGLLGLVDRGKEVFRESKVGLANEAQMVIDKLQNPNRNESFYVTRMKYKGVDIDRSTVARIFSRWRIKQYKTAFVSNLERLDREPDPEDSSIHIETTKIMKAKRLVDANMIDVLSGMSKYGMYVSAPGLFTIWAYLEELAIFPILESMGLTGSERGYDWLEHLLLNIGRIFYGIPSYSRACESEEYTLPLFCSLVTLPCNDTFLNGLASITSQQVFELQKWLVKRVQELGLITGKRLLFDFHHIDRDVDMDRLRDFGKGPSPKKKVCYNGFRPHIAWDLDTGDLVVAEFRKASARGTTTMKRFVKDFLFKPFKGVFHEVYLDSEYTGKDVWNFILDKEIGMGASLTACIKQNPMVRKARDAFLLNNKSNGDFWIYYDDEHVYSDSTFTLNWEYKYPKTGEKKALSLDCVVKKNVRSGKLRCFGTSKIGSSPEEILAEYSHRWVIENGIKDLIYSYFMDKCPGTTPHLVNVHFLSVTICRQIYHMIQRDLGSFIKNADDSVKSLGTMREVLFRQGNARVMFSENTYEIRFLNSFSADLTQELARWFRILENRWNSGLNIIGDSKFKFILQPPHGEEHRNRLQKVPLEIEKISGSGKI